MSYVNGQSILPKEIVKLIQTYVDGAYIYIPRKIDNKKEWGASTSTRNELDCRNRLIYAAYQKGDSAKTIAEVFYLSTKSIQRIILQMKKM